MHLEADLHATVAWATKADRRWAFSLSNAGANYAEFRDRLDQLQEVGWAAVASTDFRDSDVKERKQAEFLVHEFFPWELVEKNGVISQAVGCSSRQCDAHHRAPAGGRNHAQLVLLKADDDRIHDRRHPAGGH